MVTVSVAGDAETAGTPLPGVDVRLAGDGEILVAGPVVAGGGVLHTGDLGRFDERGNLTVVGRKADTIVSGGENVAPAEVEAVLLAHPAVAEAGVFARPHPEWGEAVSAKVVLRPRGDRRTPRSCGPGAPPGSRRTRSRRRWSSWTSSRGPPRASSLRRRLR